jgi:putative peptide zinc metalloprotease protein
LAVPPGPPDEFADQSADRRFEGRLWWLTVLLLVMALVLTGLSFRPGPAWAEMPGDNVLLTVERGQANASLAGDINGLVPGDRRYLADKTLVEVPTGANAKLTFAGGAQVILCAGSRVELGRVATAGGRHRSPSGTVALQAGRVLASTGSPSGAFRPLALTVSRAQGDVTNSGPAWFSVDPTAVRVSTGTVSVGDTPSAATGAKLDCGDGVAVTPPPTSEPDPETTEEPFPTDDATVDPSGVPSASLSPTATDATTDPAATTDPTQPAGTTNPTTRPTTLAPTTRPTTRPTTPKPPGTTPATTPATTPPTTPPTDPPTDPTTPAASSVESSAPAR